MSDSSSWSLPLGRWMRVHVRVHALFLVVAVFTLFLATRGADTGAPHAAIAIGVLLASVLLHEWGHALAAIRVGGSAETLLIGPLGGLRFVEVPREPHAELIASLAGPLVNLGILLAVLPVLLLSGVAVPGLLNPLEPVELMQGPLGIVALKLTLWINWLILLANLLPAFPFDGARMLRAMLRPALDERGATLVAVRASKLTALGLCVWAWLASDSATGAALPSWVPILSLAILVYFSAAQEAGPWRTSRVGRRSVELRFFARIYEPRAQHRIAPADRRRRATLAEQPARAAPPPPRVPRTGRRAPSRRHPRAPARTWHGRTDARRARACSSGSAPAIAIARATELAPFHFRSPEHGPPPAGLRKSRIPLLRFAKRVGFPVLARPAQSRQPCNSEQAAKRCVALGHRSRHVGIGTVK